MERSQEHQQQVILITGMNKLYIPNGRWLDRVSFDYYFMKVKNIIIGIILVVVVCCIGIFGTIVITNNYNSQYNTPPIEKINNELKHVLLSDDVTIKSYEQRDEQLFLKVNVNNKEYTVLYQLEWYMCGFVWMYKRSI